LVHFPHRLRAYGIEALRSLRAHRRKAVLAQHAQMLRHCGLGNPEFRLHHRRHLSGGSLVFKHQFQKASADRIAEDIEGVHQPSPV